MDNQQEHYRHIMLFYFKKGKQVAETRRKICAVYGRNAVSERACHIWFSRFKTGNFSVQDGVRTGRPSKIDSKKVKQLVDSYPQYSTRVIAGILETSKSSVDRCLRRLGYVNRHNAWWPAKSATDNTAQPVLAEPIESGPFFMKTNPSTSDSLEPLEGERFFLEANSSTDDTFMSGECESFLMEINPSTNRTSESIKGEPYFLETSTSTDDDTPKSIKIEPLLEADDTLSDLLEHERTTVRRGSNIYRFKELPL